jgi:hypothetical protein
MVIQKNPHIRREWEGGERPSMPPQWVLDKVAEESITGKYNVKRSNLCERCYQYRSANGTCGCE